MVSWRNRQVAVEAQDTSMLALPASVGFHSRKTWTAAMEPRDESLAEATRGWHPDQSSRSVNAGDLYKPTGFDEAQLLSE